MNRWARLGMHVAIAWLVVSLALVPFYLLYGGDPLWSLRWGWLGPLAVGAHGLAEHVVARVQARRDEQDPWAAHERNTTLWWEEPHDPEPPDQAA